MLSQDEIIQISKRQLKLDDLIKKHIHTYLSYRYIETEDATEAFQIENLIKAGHLKAGKPLLNPGF